MEISAQQAAFDVENRAAFDRVKAWPHAKRMQRAIVYVHRYFDFTRHDAQAYDRYTKLIEEASIVFFVKQTSLHKHF